MAAPTAATGSPVGGRCPGGQADFRDNVENVVLPVRHERAHVGEGRGEVARRRRARQRRPAGPQDFALVVSNAPGAALVTSTGPGTVAAATRWTTRTATAISKTSESFALRRVRNTGTDVAAHWPRSPAAARSASRRRTRPGHHGRLQPGERHRLRGHAGRRGGLWCGRHGPAQRDERRGRHAVRAGHDSHRTRGRPTTHSRTQTLAIPDDNAGGVMSALRADQRTDQGPRRSHQQHRPQFRGRPRRSSS